MRALGETQKFAFGLGDLAQDRVTGFRGIVISRTQWYTNCNTYQLRSETLHKGKPVALQSFDEPQLVSVMAAARPPEVRKDGKTGGPTTAPPKTNRL